MLLLEHDETVAPRTFTPTITVTYMHWWISSHLYSAVSFPAACLVLHMVVVTIMRKTRHPLSSSYTERKILEGAPWQKLNYCTTRRKHEVYKISLDMKLRRKNV